MNETQLAAALRRHLGASVDIVEPLVPIDTSYGPSAFGCRISGASVPVDWEVPLIVRIPSEADGNGAVVEAAALEVCGRHGFPAPRLLAVLNGPIRAVVTTRPDGPGLIDLMMRAKRSEPKFSGLSKSDDWLDGLADLHARLHGLVLAPDESDLVPTLDVVAELNGVSPDHTVAAEWLSPRTALKPPLVLCHCGMQPFALSLEGSTLTVRNWTDAILATPEFDVAATLLAFWAAPFFATNRSDRAGMKLIRDTLSKSYLRRYETHRPLDHDALDTWTVFHAIVLAARVARTYRGPRVRAAEVPIELAEAAIKHARRHMRRSRR